MRYHSAGGRAALDRDTSQGTVCTRVKAGWGCWPDAGGGEEDVTRRSIVSVAWLARTESRTPAGPIRKSGLEFENGQFLCEIGTEMTQRAAIFHHEHEKIDSGMRKMRETCKEMWGGGNGQRERERGCLLTAFQSPSPVPYKHQLNFLCLASTKHSISL